MLDARNTFRKVSRSICDFSPEQQKNIAAIVWLYRGQRARFLNLVESYLDRATSEGEVVGTSLREFQGALGKVTQLMEPFAKERREGDPLVETWKELSGAKTALESDIKAFGAEILKQTTKWHGANRDNTGLHTARVALHPMADRCRDLTKQIDLAVKLSGRVIDICVKELQARESDLWSHGEVTRAHKDLETARVTAVEALRRVRYFLWQADWLQERFPDAKLRDVEGLVKLVDRTGIAAYDWNLSPSRYVDSAPEEEDENFDFVEALRSLHIDLKGLNEEAVELAARIARNFEELGA
jgi:type I restriction enzyme M protein